MLKLFHTEELVSPVRPCLELCEEVPTVYEAMLDADAGGLCMMYTN
jgi:hypothetical protein